MSASGASALPRWRFGAVDVTPVVETTSAFSQEALLRLLPEATPAALAELPWLAPRWADERFAMRFVTQSFLLVSEGRRVLVDTCLGNDKPRRNPAFDRLQTRFLAELARAGAPPERVDVVLCTHLHFDHVGWNTRWDGGRWVPTFPNARYLVARSEWEHWAARPDHGWLFDDSLAPVAAAGLVDLVDPGHAVTGEVDLVATPGHTPGHVSVRIRSHGEEALVTGDLLHHPCQVARLAWGGPADADVTLARATRAAVVADAERRGVVLLGSHFAEPAAGRVVTPSGSAERRFEGLCDAAPTCPAR